MRGKFSVGSQRMLLAMFTLTLLATSVYAHGEKILHRFGKGSDGAYPYAGLIFDTSGNLYGTTFFGGAHGAGAVFELAPNAKGGWTEEVLYSFGGGTDGANPYASLVFDATGNLYGTTYQGGAYTLGTVFELTPNGGGGWTEKILHSFGNGTDGADPYASLIFDTVGNLYGTTYQGGVSGLGTVFELTPKRGGWREKVVHSFGDGTDGANPYASLVFDAAGNLYGTTYLGGVYSYGTAFELTPKGGGSWKEKVLYSFGNAPDGANPYSGLIFDASGNLYGTTGSGGVNYLGAVFELTPEEGGTWTETILNSFNFTNGSNPQAGLIFDVSGNLYGATYAGGANESGTVFELIPGGGGGVWTEKDLHNFIFNDKDGANPYASLIFDAAGNLYGTTNGSGTYGAGTVFQITP